MNRAILFITAFLIIFAVTLAGVWFVAGPDESKQTQNNNQDLTRENGSTEPGEVAVTVTLVTEQNFQKFDSDDLDLGLQHVFYVEMNTHSVDITKLKMDEISFLTLGSKTIKVLKWKSATEGGIHHRSGHLFFSKAGEAKKIKLVIKSIAGIAVREFKWSL